MASVAARVRCRRGANQMLPSSMAAWRGCMSMSVIQPETTPVATGRTAQAIGSWLAASSATWAAKASSVGNGP